MRDDLADRLSRAWQAAGVGSPSRLRDHDRGVSPWRNPGDHHEQQHRPFEDHTICSATHAAAALSRYPPSMARGSSPNERRARPASAASPSKRAGPEICRGLNHDSLQRLAPDEVIAMLDDMFKHDDEGRRRLRHLAIRTAGEA